MYTSKGKTNCLILQSIPQPSTTAVNIAPIHEYFQNHELEHTEEQEKRYLALLGNDALFCRNLLLSESHDTWLEGFDKLINLS